MGLVLIHHTAYCVCVCVTEKAVSIYFVPLLSTALYTTESNKAESQDEAQGS
jgi:hypothetical protein